MSNYSLLTNKNGIKWDISANNVTLVSLNGSGTASGQYLKSNGTNAPSWAPISGGSQSLASVMNIGNMASQNLDMSSNSITNVPNINSPSNTNLTISSSYITSGTGQVLIQNTATTSGPTRTSQLILLSGSAGSGTIEPQAQLICVPGTVGYPAPSIQLTAGPPNINTRGVIITNNALNSGGQTNIINCSNSNIEISCDSGGTFTPGQFLQLIMSNLKLSLLYANTPSTKAIFEIENGLFTSNGNLTFGLNPQTNYQMGILERAVIEPIATQTVYYLSFSDCFLTRICTPPVSLSTRTYYLPNPPGDPGYSGYWIAICNRSVTYTVDIRQDDGTVLCTVPKNPADNDDSGGSTARFSISSTGLSWFRVS
jgi:hypothetical protein